MKLIIWGSKPMPCVRLKFASHTACCTTQDTLGERDEPDRRSIVQCEHYSYPIKITQHEEHVRAGYCG
jgi:hypothetical protein